MIPVRGARHVLIESIGRGKGKPKKKCKRKQDAVLTFRNDLSVYLVTKKIGSWYMPKDLVEHHSPDEEFIRDIIGMGNKLNVNSE